MTDERPTRPTRSTGAAMRAAGGVVGRLGPGGTAVAIAGFAVNLFGFAVPLLGARTLTPGDLGALATVLALAAIASVAGQGLQAAVAVRVARAGSLSNAGRATLGAAGFTAGCLLLATPVITVALHLSPALTLLVTATVVPVVIGSRWLGELQGAQRFLALATAMGLLAVARYGGIIVGLAAGTGVTASVALGAAVGWLSLPVLALLARPGSGGRRVAAEGGESTRLHTRDVAAACGATLAMLAVSYADLILARHLLPTAESGAYAVGSVLTKGALWAPQVVTVLALPRLGAGQSPNTSPRAGGGRCLRCGSRCRVGGRRRVGDGVGRRLRLHAARRVRRWLRDRRCVVRGGVRARQRRDRRPGAVAGTAALGCPRRVRHRRAPIRAAHAGSDPHRLGGDRRRHHRRDGGYGGAHSASPRPLDPCRRCRSLRASEICVGSLCMITRNSTPYRGCRRIPGVA